ncbi:sigma-70 family RNA polymerase sigma factor [Glycomyces sp. NEAU-7082]|jgi:RNA polymerase sigma-70 factor (ECF subfamily)|uniref:Sigma-70 family RNA polymerase sigma factor n=2 Tax=Glycomyces albidus TaxID=2656774 RepID=A0A6L5G236_9ACTN|nr:sigma-70 family RNA polymerase sigma factor [Glycomyces albidus]
MDEGTLSAERFEEHRAHLRAVAYRMLGSLSEAEDAVQEAWIKAARADVSGVENLRGWLTTVVSRVCLDLLRSRKSRREDPLDERPVEPAVRLLRRSDPEAELVMADSVGLALLVVMEALSPVERLAFVLHDLFAVPFADIAPIVDRSPETTQRIASRARRRVRDQGEADAGDRLRRFRAVDAFMQAARDGEFATLLSMLDPEATYRPDEAARLLGAGTEMFGARAIAEAFSGAGQWTQAVLLNGDVGVVLAPRGKLRLVLTVSFKGDRIAAIEAFAEPERLAAVELRLP